MRVLYFSDNTSGHNRRFLEKLVESGHEVWFLNSSTGDLPAGWLPSEVRAWRPSLTIPAGLSSDDYREFVPEFKRCIGESRPDLVHAGPVTSAAYVAALSQFHPLLVTSWGSDILAAVEDPTRRESIAVALRGADGFFCDCDAVRRRALEFADIPSSRIAQFPWGVKPGVFSPRGAIAREVSALGGETIPFISTRSWEPLYGIATMLEAFRLAYVQDDHLRLILLGHGSLESQVRAFAAQHHLERSVLTPGSIPTPELPAWFRAAKAYISCSSSDGTSVSLLEAMATGLPVLVSDLPANREWVHEGVNGWLAAPESAEDFAAGMLKIAALSSGAREEVSARNHAVVAERADWDRNFPRLLDLYESMIKGSMRTEKAG